MKNLLLIVFLAIPAFLFSQFSFPENGKLYNDQLVPRIDINIAPADLNFILDPANSQSYQEFPATFVFNDGTNIDTVANVGFRLRGNTSRFSRKKSFKVSFNTFTQGGKFDGVEKINLNGEHNDPSIIRAKLGWDLMRAAGVPAPRSNHVEFYINDDYFGLYINVEHIDEEFTESRFGTKNGNLYKCLYPADLAYLGSDPNLYKFQANGRRAYALKTNENVDDYSNLAEFIDILNNTSLNNLPCELEKVFNVDLYLKAMAVDIITANWDGPIFNKNNFYLYENPRTGKIEYIPYDLDNTFGIDWFNIDWGTRNIYSWSPSNETRPIYTRLMAVPEYKDQYTFHLTELLNGFMDNPGYFSYIDNIKAMIDPSAIADNYRTLDYGYSVSDYHSSYTSALGGHVKYGVKPFVSARKNSALSQANNNNIKPIVFTPEFSVTGINQPLIFTVLVKDETPPMVVLNYRFDNGSWQIANMVDDGSGDDEKAGDDIFTATLSGLSTPGLIEYYIEATDSQGETTREPRCEDYSFEFAQPGPSLVINELMSDNVSYKADGEGEFDDWIEIYNLGNEPVYLGDFYLSDDFSNPNRWQMPDLTIQPGEYLVFWADGQGHQGDFHTNFGLSKSGEEVGIFNSMANGYSVIDTVSFGALDPDQSYARFPNGTGSFSVAATPTFQGNNGASSIGAGFIPHLELFPNPFDEYFEITVNSDRLNSLSIELINTQGRTVHFQKLSLRANQVFYPVRPTQLVNGIYFAMIRNRENEVIKVFKVVKI
jgi:spore coat protein H